MAPAPGTPRLATRDDATALGDLFAITYRPDDGGTASDHYPFPQVLDPEWVARVVEDGSVRWQVWELDGRVVGSAAALPNIGSPADRVAEIFGVVVHPDVRHLRIGTFLLRALCSAFEAEAMFVICEARTAVASASRIAQRNGFIALGFEPFAHATPAGAESMLLTGRVSSRALQQRATKIGPAPDVMPLAHIAIGQLRSLPPCPFESTADAPPAHLEPRTGEDSDPIQIKLDAETGQRLLDQIPVDDIHRSGVVALRRLEGESHGSDRYDRRNYVTWRGGHPIGACRVVVDWMDRRARVMKMWAADRRVRRFLIESLVHDLSGLRNGQLLTISVDVLGHDRSLTEAVCSLGFRPTVYYPALVNLDDRRWDAVQYTKLLRLSASDAARSVAGLDWLEASAAIDSVAHSFAHEPIRS